MMTTLTASYVDTSGAFLSKAEAALAEGDLVKASRKGWCAAAWALRGFARAKGWRYTGFYGIVGVIEGLAQEYADEEFYDLYSSVDALAVNGARCCDSRGGIEHDLSRVAELLRKLERLPA